MKSKYEPLWNYIKEKKMDELKLTFLEIKNIVNFPIDHSFLNYKKELKEYGYEVFKISKKEEYVIFKRTKEKKED